MTILLALPSRLFIVWRHLLGSGFNPAILGVQSPFLLSLQCHVHKSFVIKMSSVPFQFAQFLKFLLSLPRAPMMIGTIINLLTLHGFATSLPRCSYLPLLSFYLSITFPSNRLETSTILHLFSSLSRITMSGPL